MGRREFIRTVSGGAAALAGIGAVGLPRMGFAEDKPAVAKSEKPSESLVKELFATLSPDQKKSIVLPWNHKDKDGNIVRLRMYNAPSTTRTSATSTPSRSRS